MVIGGYGLNLSLNTSNEFPIEKFRNRLVSLEYSGSRYLINQ